MEGWLARLASYAARRRLLVVGAWIALLALSAPLSARQTERLSGGGWEVPGGSFARAQELLERFPQHDGVPVAVLAEGDTPAAARVALADARSKLGRFRLFRPIGEVQPLDGGRALLLSALYTGPRAEVYTQSAELRAALVSDAEGARTRVIGEGPMWSEFNEVAKEQLARAETIGFPLILAILLAAFGTLVAATMPLLLGFVAVFLTGAAIYLLSLTFEMSVYVTNLASMIGIGVAVDYSLFVVSRFRRCLREGRSRDDSLREALSSAGTAVVFSGATVVVSLASLFLVDLVAIRSMAAGAIVVVAIAVVATVTLLPALLALVGRRIERLRVAIPGRRERPDGAFWAEWSRRVMRRPAPALAVAAALVLALAAPTLAMRTQTQGLTQLPADSEVRQATERVAELAGPGALEPLQVVTSDRGVAEAVARDARDLGGVAAVRSPVSAPDGSAHVVEVVAAFHAESEAASALLERVEALVDRHAAERRAEAVVGGSTAFGADVEEAMFGGLWKIVLFVLACSYVVLLVLLRSVLLPLKAILMNLLSVGAAYGVLVAVFQWGWLDWTGYDSPGYLDTIVPTFLFAVTFGLSMDYEVFLLTRIRERYLAGAPNDVAVAEGLAASARTITAAALVMVAVFGAFTFAGATSIKQLGLGLAIAILLDATIVRLVIVPATMRLLGDWNWWFPRWLARVPGGGEPTGAAAR